MALRDIVQSGAALAFNAAGNLVETCTYIQNTVPTYDAEDDEVVTATTQHPGVRVAFSSYGALFGNDATMVKEEFSGKLAALFLAAELPVKPRNNDYILRPNGDRLKIGGLRGDPTFTVYTALVEKV